jgi:phosphoserine phosphatase RsbU/P
MRRTFFYGEVDEEQHPSRFRYVNGGHNPPYLLRGEAFRELTDGGPIVGMFPEMPYGEGDVELESGDLLILFSDGVPEAQNPAQDKYTEERLKQAVLRHRDLPVGELSNRVLDELKGWILDAEQYDDMTLVIVRVR